MNRKRWVAVISAAGVAVAMSGCASKEDVEKLKQDVQALQKEDQDLRNYTKAGGPLNEWLKELAEAVCQLELNNPGGLDPAKRYCKGPGPGDKKPPPTYP